MNEMPRNTVTAEGEFVQIKKIGNSLGLILSKCPTHNDFLDFNFLRVGG